MARFLCTITFETFEAYNRASSEHNFAVHGNPKQNGGTMKAWGIQLSPGEIVYSPRDHKRTESSMKFFVEVEDGTRPTAPFIPGLHEIAFDAVATGGDNAARS